MLSEEILQVLNVMLGVRELFRNYQVDCEAVDQAGVVDYRAGMGYRHVSCYSVFDLLVSRVFIS